MYRECVKVDMEWLLGRWINDVFRKWERVVIRKVAIGRGGYYTEMGRGWLLEVGRGGF